MASLYDARRWIGGIGVWLAIFGGDRVITWMVVARDAYMCNSGVAMGVAVPLPVLVVLWVGIMAALVRLWKRTARDSVVTHMAFMMIFAGAMSNAVDRMIYGCVVDYVPFLHISSFNIADVGITCGALVVLWRMVIRS